MTPLARFARHYLLALQFFTRVPVTGRLAAWVGFSPAMLRASAAHMPGVGALVGLITAAVLAAAWWALPTVPASPWLAVALSTVCSVMLTGAFHEDGLADLTDGLGGSYDKARALDIMKDSRIGSFGAMALVLALLVKCAALAVLAQVHLALAVVSVLAAHVVSRTLPLFTIRTLPHVGDTPHSKSKPLADAVSTAALCAALLWCALVVAGLLCLPLWGWVPWGVAAGGWLLGSGVVGAGLGWAWVWRLLNRRLQGFTGDGLGTTQQISELGFYLGVALALGHGGLV